MQQRSAVAFLRLVAADDRNVRLQRSVRYSFFFGILAHIGLAERAGDVAVLRKESPSPVQW